MRPNSRDRQDIILYNVETAASKKTEDGHAQNQDGDGKNYNIADLNHREEDELKNLSPATVDEESPDCLLNEDFGDPGQHEEEELRNPSQGTADDEFPDCSLNEEFPDRLMNDDLEDARHHEDNSEEVSMSNP